MRPTSIFLICSIALVVTVLTIGDATPPIDPFDDQAPDKTMNFEGYGERQIALLKIRHGARRGRPYDIALIGNSRILSVGREHLDTATCSVFNYALSGQSFRSSVLLLERLAREKTLPRLAVISVDNFELQMSGNPVWIGWRQRMSVFPDDLGAAFRDADTNLRDKLRVLWRYIWTEKIIFQRQFEFSFFRRAVIDALGLNASPFPAVDAGEAGYRPDGSYRSSPPPGSDIAVLPRATPQIIDAVFRHDLERLFRMARENDLKLFLYESPLHPATAAVFDQAPSPFAGANRRAFAQVCKAFGTTCLAAPQEKFRRAEGWQDVSHPPPDVLGHWISTTLTPYQLERCSG